ncbi:MAG: hypothetical protein GXP29_03255 [Planctomycetes bacterium]|nr:hypothetical protein [Planctomycetota bacterium]
MIKLTRTFVGRFFVASVAVASPVLAQQQAPDDAGGVKPEVGQILAEHDGPLPMYVEQGPTLTSTLYVDGSRIQVPTTVTTRCSCFNDPGQVTLADLKQAVQQVEQIRAQGDIIMVNDRGAERGAGLNIVFAVAGGPPANVLTAIEEAAVYVESQFSDPITVNLNLTWANIGGLAFTQNVNAITSYSVARSGLINGMDADDSIQNFLPSGPTIPVRYNGNSATVTNENQITFAKDNFRATIGSFGGSSSSISINSTVSYDFDPSNGIVFSQFSFQDILLHEMGHALGFTSATDTNAFFGSTDMEALDIFRFQRTDGVSDLNPDTFAEFQTTPRTVDQNTPPDDANVDIIDFEYRMADGNPNQASHFREQSPNIGVMDPIIANGETTFPDQYKESDINMLDAIGWDFVSGDCNNNTIVDLCEVDCGNPGCGGVPGCGTAADCNADGTPDDCQLNGNDCNANTVPDDCEEAALLTGQPSPLGVCPGDPAAFSVTSAGAGSFQWKLDGVDVVNGGGISGATTDTLNISSTDETDQGVYTCEVADGCIVVTSSLAALDVFDPSPHNQPLQTRLARVRLPSSTWSHRAMA